MSKHIAILALGLLASAASHAVPAKRIKTAVKQPDGTSLIITVRGDEHFHFTSTEDGMPLVRATDGAYCYAVLDKDGRLAPSSQIAHSPSARSAQEIGFLRTYSSQAEKVKQIGAERRAARNASRTARLQKRAPHKMVGAGGGEGIGVTGKRKGLVILVNFQDVKMQSKHTQAEWNNYFNLKGYSKLGNSGSVHDYFYNQSYGLFDLEFDVVGPVTVSKKMAAYGANDANGDDTDPAGMVYEACQLAADQVNFADYDWDGDGEADQVYLIYAGYGEASNSNTLANCIWQHEWELEEAGYSLTIDGVKINTYGCSSELNGDSGSYMDGIGTACHEFSHCLGIPDLYDTSGNGNYGMDEWDLMDYGSYAGDGYRPVGYNSYERWVSGWLQPTELSSPCFVKDMKALSESPEAYIVYNDAHPTEYYLLENRQGTGNDEEIPSSGMLVIHVDYDYNAWETNTINNRSYHQRFTIIPADNQRTSATNFADTYPGTMRNTSLTDTSTPAAALYNANKDGRKFMGKPITEISESLQGLVSFTFMGGETVNTPSDLASQDITADAFRATWSAVEEAESYNVELRESSADASPEACQLVSEDLSGWGANLKSDGNTDISSKLDEKMTTKGWTGIKVFEGIGCAKLGSAKVQGELTSPLLTNLQSDAITVRILTKPYGADEARFTLYLTASDGSDISSCDITPDGTLTTVVLDNKDASDCRLTIKPKKRGYVCKVAVYDGDFTEDDFTASPAAAPRKKATQKINGISEPLYSFSDLNAASTYQWRVQAVKGTVLSPWSPWQTVVLNAASSISGTVATATLTPSTPVDLFSADGTWLRHTTYGEFLDNPAHHGVFILKTKEGVAKVVR